MRKITSHIVNECNEKLTITAVDGAGPGGASHRYDIDGMDSRTNESVPNSLHHQKVILAFQHGTVPEKGPNGVTHEALLAIVMDRLEGFQSGPYKCADNEEALIHLRAAQTALQRRTRSRMARGVEGTHKI